MLSHQFEDAEQQREAATLGLWTFLLTEVMLFGGLFAGYTAYRAAYPEAFILGSGQLDVMLGGVNTAVLICSSLTMALAVRSAQLGKRQALIVFLVLTMLFGSAFWASRVSSTPTNSTSIWFPVPTFASHRPTPARCNCSSHSISP